MRDFRRGRQQPEYLIANGVTMAWCSKEGGRKEGRKVPLMQKDQPGAMGKLNNSDVT